MSWSIPITPQHSGEPLTPAQLLPPAPACVQDTPADTCNRAEIEARAAACRPCPHVGSGGQTCATCDLRCTHPAAQPGRQLLARRDSICPTNLWAVTP